MISIVVPCYNEKDALPYFYQELRRAMAQLNDVQYELLLVDDGSMDSTLKIMEGLAAADGRVFYISFSRNFGKEAAIYAGLQYARGEQIVIMDADLQDPPSLLPEMYRAITEEGYDSVATRRVTRKGEPPIRSFFARLFYKLMRRISKTELVDGARDYRMMSRRFVDALLKMSEYSRFSKGLFGWVGFQTKWLEYENQERVAGTTKWSFFSLFQYSIEGIVAFSTLPLSLSFCFGAISCIGAFGLIIYSLVQRLCFNTPITDGLSIITVVLLLGGIQLLGLGILGQYLSKTYLETKRRPIYLVKETNREFAPNEGTNTYARSG